MQKILVTLSFATSLTILSGCALLATSSPAPKYSPIPLICEVFVPITFDREKDTEDTIRQIKAHNAVWVDLCRPKSMLPEAGLPRPGFVQSTQGAGMARFAALSHWGGDSI